MPSHGARVMAEEETVGAEAQPPNLPGIGKRRGDGNIIKYAVEGQPAPEHCLESNGVTWES